MILSQPKNICSRFSIALLTMAALALTGCGTENGNNNALPDDTTSESIVDTPNTGSEKILTEIPNYTDKERESILEQYNHLDPQRIVPSQALEDAVLYFAKNKSQFANQEYISVINFAQSSKEKRFYIINIKSGAVWPIHVAHGKGSDANHDGFAESFSNISGSNASSLGAYRTAETYYGNHGLSLRLDGLSVTNSKARARAVVIHGADYVQESNVIQGRSWGCPAVAQEYRDAVVKYLKGGSLIWAVVDKGGSKVPTPKPPVGSYEVLNHAWTSSSYPERQLWSNYLVKLVMEDWNSLLKGADDMHEFCPSYNKLDEQDRANVWAQLFVAMAKYESGYKPTSRMHETTMGTDPVTNKPVYSEGLLQLSYQDTQWASWCNFDWNQDKNLSATDPKKSILDPYKNLHCGVGIMAKQVARTGKIKVSSGAYWAVIKTNSKYEQIDNITSMVKSLSVCQ